MSLDRERVQEILESFKNLRILVVGDVILDRYLFGSVERISPEAPVPVVDVQREESRLGGAGNVANNLASLGVKSSLLAVVGQDYGRHVIRGLLKEAGVEDLTVEDTERPTTEKIRVVAMSQQLLRIDSESKNKVSGKVLENLLQRLEVEVDCVIVSDYAKGVVCSALMDGIRSKKRSKRVFFSVDPRPQNKNLYVGANLMTPNEKEAKSMLAEESLQTLGWRLKGELRLDTLVITLGQKGMALFNRDFKVFPAKAKQVYDVSGAGDTVVAVLTACTVAGVGWDTACEFANLCAGIVVGKLGTATLKPEEIFQSLEEGCGV
ncbi:MAG: D-glycero-beta-D-manno-heptose-7-phosphate kinase [Aquificaceae bacterium]|nr:D-glycero-beta-D-manno-heptose-7-phosphate kinase [Aquificaceae bacterium]